VSAFSGLQIDFGAEGAAGYAERVDAAFQQSGSRCPIQIQTSSNDCYRDTNIEFALELERRGFEVELLVSRGPHNAAWMSEVGSLETVLFQDRVLRGAAPES